MKVLKCRNCHWINGKVHSMCIYCEFPLVKAERDKYKAALDFVFSILNGDWGARQAVQLAQEAIIKTLEP